MGALWRWIRWLMESILIGGVGAYRLVIRPFLPPSCRYTPSCSEYFIQAVRKHGPICGSAKGVWRICRCNPFYPGGFDPP